MTVAAHWTQAITAVNSNMSLRAAAEQMGKEQVSLLLVQDQGQSVGVLTDRDLVLDLADPTRDAESSRVAEAMTTPAVTIRADAPLGDAMALMRRKGVRRLPVVDSRKPAIGIIAVDDVVALVADETSRLAAVAAAQLLPAAPEREPAPAGSKLGGGRTAERYVREVVSVSADSTLAQVAAQMKERCVGCVVVVDGAGEAIGILTDRDLALRAVALGRGLGSTSASAIMSAPLVSGEPSQTVPEILEEMQARGVRRIPILKAGRPVGMVTFDDLLIGLGRELEQLGGAAARGQRSERNRLHAERARSELRRNLEQLTGTLGRIGRQTTGMLGRGLEATRRRLGRKQR